MVGERGAASKMPVAIDAVYSNVGERARYVAMQLIQVCSQTSVISRVHDLWHALQYVDSFSGFDRPFKH